MKKIAMGLMLILSISTTSVIANAATIKESSKLTMTTAARKSFTVYMKSDANIYAWPSLNGSVVGSVRAGEAVTTKGSVTNNMAQITTKSGITGYVSVNAIDAKG